MIKINMKIKENDIQKYLPIKKLKKDKKIDRNFVYQLVG